MRQVLREEIAALERRRAETDDPTELAEVDRQLRLARDQLRALRSPYIFWATPGKRLEHLREVDRRVGQRAWKKVRHPRLPAWVWLLVDLHVGGLVVAGMTGLAGMLPGDSNETTGLVGLALVIGVSVTNFTRATRV